MADTVLSAAPHEYPERALAWAGEAGNHILTLADADYPRRLFDIADPRRCSTSRAERATTRPGIALVGARSATAAGEANAEAFARALAQQGLVVISGAGARHRRCSAPRCSPAARAPARWR